MRHKKGFIRVLHIFNMLTLPTLIGLVILFVIQDIGLKHLFPFIVVYLITLILELFLSRGSGHTHHIPHSHHVLHPFVHLLIGNIVTTLLIIYIGSRYHLHSYLPYIIIGAISIFNLLYIIIYRGFMKTIIGYIKQMSFPRWMTRTLGLIIISGIIIALYNSLDSSKTSFTPKKPRKTQSEITGVLSTVDPTKKQDINTLLPPPPWNSIDEHYTLGTSSTGVLQIQEYLRSRGYYTGEITRTYDTALAQSINLFLRDIAQESFTRVEFGPQKLALLRAKDTDTTTPVRTDKNQHESQGILSTDTSKQKPGITIDSIESVDGNAQARIEDGKIIVQVVSGSSIPSKSVNTGDAWSITTDVESGRGAGGLQGIVISAPIGFPMGGDYQTYQSITLKADGASGIFFTIDGSDPSCQGRGHTTLTTPEKVVTIRAIACFAGNKIRGPLSVSTYKKQ